MVKRRTTTRAAAPSEIDDALAAVMVPFFGTITSTLLPALLVLPDRGVLGSLLVALLSILDGILFTSDLDDDAAEAAAAQGRVLRGDPKPEDIAQANGLSPRRPLAVTTRTSPSSSAD